MKQSDYHLMCKQIRSLAEISDRCMPVLANAGAILYEGMDDLNWAGFYLVEDDHLILAGLHEKHRENSEYHIHNYVSTTNLRNGKMLHAKNENNFPMAQRLANITQQEVLLVIEKRKPNSLEIDHSRKPYEKVFKPQKNKK